MVRPLDKKARATLGDHSLGSGDANIDDQAAFYDEFWDVWHEKYRRFISPLYHFDENSRMFMIQRALNLYVGSGDGREAFDLGCGRGRLAHLLHTLGWKAGGIDLSPQTIASLNIKYPEIDFHAGDMFAYESYKLEHFDLVTSSEVFEHIQPSQRGDFVELVRKLLKRNGILILTTPNEIVMDSLELRAEQPLDFWLNPDELIQCFENGFELIAFHTASFCVKGKYRNMLLKLIPVINTVMDRALFDTKNGKYQMLVVRRKD